MSTKEVYNALVLGIKDYFKKNNFQKAVIGLSGGLDSSVAVSLAVKALGSRNVTAVLMPDTGVTSENSMMHAKELVKKLGINHKIIPINDFLSPFKKIEIKNKKNEIYSISNSKARARNTDARSSPPCCSFLKPRR